MRPSTGNWALSAKLVAAVPILTKGSLLINLNKNKHDRGQRHFSFERQSPCYQNLPFFLP